MLEQFGFLSRQKIVFVTDRGANIKAALSHDTRLNCAAHLINNVLETTFKENNLQHSPCLQPIAILLRSCQEVVAYFKRAALMDKLETSLVQIVPTRWNTHLAMLSSVYRNLEQIKKVSLVDDV